MVKHVGVALEYGLARVCYLEGGREVTSEHAWDGREPARLVDALSADIGRVSGIALSIGLGFLEIARPELPSMAADDRRRVLTRDADRYFPLQGAVAVAAATAGGFAYAMPAVELHRIVHAFEEWAPVRAVVAAPDAVGKVTANSITIAVDAGEGERGFISIVNGNVTEVRRTFASAPGHSSPTSPTEQARASDRYLTARGALGFVDGPLSTMLLDSTIEQELQSMRTRRSWWSVALAAAACIALVLSLDARRDATLRSTVRAADSVSALAAPALAVRARLDQLDRERALLGKKQPIASDPLAVLAALSKALPSDAFVQRIEWDGTEWKLEGSANQAADIVPSLDGVGAFTAVRVLSASTRFRDGDRMRESFSVAFRASDAVRGDSSGRR
ncbi:MAG: PilN domain-containing protein [Gemmatimonas sp.]